jgi:NADH-quinone oxidoreductase subunit F
MNWRKGRDEIRLDDAGWSQVVNRAGVLRDFGPSWWEMSELLLTKRFHEPDGNTLKGYLRTGGYASFKRLFSMSPEQVVSEVKASGLKGRGGAGFPTGMKWSFIPRDGKKPVYLVVNADEGEPGTFTDRYVLERDPHLMLEGMVAAAYAVGARTATVYVRGEFVHPIRTLEKAVAEAVEAGYLGDSIQGSGFSLDVHVHRGAGAYICGEETGLLESIEGKPGKPRIKPPFPAVEGLFGCPTVINNVKTLASVPWIVERGGAAYAAIGTKESAGTTIFGASGHVNAPGFWEHPFGVRVMDLIERDAKGVKGGRLKAVIPGGSSTPVLTAGECADAVMSYEGMRAKGSFLGTGGLIVMNEHTDMVRVLKNLTHFYADESCGQCTPCREGTAWCDRLLGRLLSGEGTTRDLDRLLLNADNMEGKTICALAAACAMPVRSFLTKFRPEFERLAKPVSAAVP